jgi:hypothetical protein
MQATDLLFNDDIDPASFARLATDYDVFDVDVADYNHAVKYGTIDNLY